MRYLLLLLFITLLCTGVRAQLEITTNLGLVENQCSGFKPDANDDCTAKANPTDKLIYRAGKDGDLLFTYRITNNAGKIIRRVQVSDSRFGNFFPEQKVNIPNGAVVPLHVIYDALTKPATINGKVVLTVTYADGSTEQVTGTYLLRALAPKPATLSSGRGFAASLSTNQRSVYPNPATDQLTLNGFAGGAISIIDMQGKVVLRTTLSSSGAVNVASLLSGVYLLRAGGEGIRWVKR